MNKASQEPKRCGKGKGIDEDLVQSKFKTPECERREKERQRQGQGRRGQLISSRAVGEYIKCSDRGVKNEARRETIVAQRRWARYGDKWGAAARVRELD